MNSDFKILIIDSCHDILPQKLTHAGFIPEVRTSLTQSELEACISHYKGLILRSKYPVDRALLNKASSLLFIGRIGAGMDNIDLQACAEKGIRCLNSPEGNRIAVAEHTVGMLLSICNNLCRANLQIRHNQWLREENRGMEIAGKTIGILGYGNMGSAVASRLSGFGANLIAYDKYKTNYAPDYVSEVSLETLFTETDILTLHIPLNPETRFMVNAEFIGNFKKNIILINTSRGKVVHTHDLVQAMQQGKVIATGLDVLEYEETSFEEMSANGNPDLEYLLNSDRTILSPHIAGWTTESKYKLADVLADKIIDIFAKRK